MRDVVKAQRDYEKFEICAYLDKAGITKLSRLELMAKFGVTSAMTLTIRSDSLYKIDIAVLRKIKGKLNENTKRRLFKKN